MCFKRIKRNRYYVLLPSIRQTTLASSSPKLSSHTVPHVPKMLTSTLPLEPPPLNRISKM